MLRPLPCFCVDEQMDVIGWFGDVTTWSDVTSTSYSISYQCHMQSVILSYMTALVAVSMIHWRRSARQYYRASIPLYSHTSSCFIYIRYIWPTSCTAATVFRCEETSRK